jgi:hypothetical protein
VGRIGLMRAKGKPLSHRPVLRKRHRQMAQVAGPIPEPRVIQERLISRTILEYRCLGSSGGGRDVNDGAGVQFCGARVVVRPLFER